MAAFRAFNIGFDSRDEEAAAAAATLPAGATFIFDVTTQTDLTGTSYNTLQDSSGAGRNLSYVSGTKCVKDSGVQLDSNDTLDTANTGDPIYRSAADVDFANDLFPNSGVGTMIVVFNADTHPDSFNAPDWIITTSGARDIGCAIVDGPAFSGQGSGAGTATVAISVDTWYVGVVRFNATNVRVHVDNGADTTTAVDSHTVATTRMQCFYSAGDGGYFDGHIAFMACWPTVLADADVTTAKAYLKSLFPSLNV